MALAAMLFAMPLGAQAVDVSVNASIADTTPPTVTVDQPTTATTYSSATIPSNVSGTAADNSNGVGLAADSTQYSLQRQSDNKYWDGSNWVTGQVFLGTTHPATTQGTVINWSSNSILPPWLDDTYTIIPRATDKSGNTGTSDDQTFKTNFLADNAKDLTKIENIEQYQKELEDTIASILPSLVPPFVSKPQVSDITEGGAIISFTTNIKAFPIVGFIEDSLYDRTKENPYLSEVSDTTAKALSHTLALTGLKSNTTYHVQARAFSLPQVVGKSDDSTFITKASKIVGSIVERKKDSFTVLWTTDEPTSSVVEYKNLNSGRTARMTDDVKMSSHLMKIEGLPPATSYEVNISGVNEKGNVVEGGTALSVMTSKDITPPAVSGFKVANALVPGRNDRIQTIVTWTTDEPSDSIVYYEEGVGAAGETKDPKNKSDLYDSLVTNHNVILSSLKPGAIYRIKITSTDESGNTGSFGPRTTLTPRQTESITDIIFKNFEDSFKFMRNI